MWVLCPEKKTRRPFFQMPVLLLFTILMITSNIIIFTPNAVSKQGGPDTYGYYWIDSNSTAPSINFSWVDGVTGGTNLNMNNDRISGFIDIGFNFPFYSELYPKIAICDNGWASFTEQLSSSIWGNPIPNTMDPNAIIAPLWTDLDPGKYSEGKVYYERFNTTSPKHFVITWESLPLFTKNPVSYDYNQTFQAILYDNGSILFQYQAINTTQSWNPIIGIEDHMGAKGLSYPKSGVENGTAVWFYFNYPDHDMVLSDISVCNYAKLNEDLLIDVNIKNMGLNNETKVNISLKINGQPVNWTGPSIVIPSFTEKPFSFIWKPQTKGNHTVEVKVEPVVGEIKTDNNKLNRLVDVRNWQGVLLYDSTHSAIQFSEFSIWFDELQKKNIMVENFDIGDITDEVLEDYDCYLACYPYQNYDNSEVNALHNFVDQGNGMVLASRYQEPHLNTLTAPYEITWVTMISGISGVTTDFKTHEITNGITNINFDYHRVELEVSGAAKGLVNDTALPKPNLVFAISNESTNNRVAALCDPYSYRDRSINNANNKLFGVQIIEWAIGDIIPPSKVKGFKAINGKVGNQVNLSWTPNNEKDLNGYHVYRGTSPGVYDPDPIFVPASAAGYRDKGEDILDHTEYFYVVAAVDEVPNISPLSAERIAIPTDIIAPAMPHNYSVSDMGTGDALKISWNKNKAPDVVEYRVYKSENLIFDSPEMILIPPENTSYSDTDVKEGKNYYYKVSAVDEVPNESILTPAKDGTPYDRIPPETPTGFNVTDPGLGNCLFLVWNHSSEDDLVDYLIERKEKTGKLRTYIVPAPANSYTDTSDLVDGKTYYYRIYARDDSKLEPRTRSEPTFWCSATPTDITPPSAPNNLTIKDESYFSINRHTPVHCLNLTWDISDDRDLRGYIIYRFDFPKFKLSEKKIIAKLTVVTDHYYDLDVEEGEEYYYKITAYDEIPNESPASAELMAVPKDVTPSPTPSEFAVEPLLEGNAVKLTWVLQADTETEGFNLYYKKDLNDTFELIAELDRSTDEFTQYDLINDRKYYYKLQSFDGIPNFSPFTSILSVIPSDILPPDKPQNLQIIIVEYGSALELSWNSNSEEDVSGYRIYRSYEGSEYGLVMAVDKNTTSAIDHGLLNEKTYRYYVTALDEVPNESDRSNIKNAVPEDHFPPTTPTNLTVELSGSEDSVIITWTPSNDSDVDSYIIFRSTDNKNYKKLAEVTFMESSYIDRSVRSGDKYYYKIAAGDKTPNLSPQSKPVQIEVPAKETWFMSNIEAIGAASVLIIVLLILSFMLFTKKQKRKKEAKTDADTDTEVKPVKSTPIIPVTPGTPGFEGGPMVQAQPGYGQGRGMQTAIIPTSIAQGSGQMISTPTKPSLPPTRKDKTDKLEVEESDGMQKKKTEIPEGSGSKEPEGSDEPIKSTGSGSKEPEGSGSEEPEVSTEPTEPTTIPPEQEHETEQGPITTPTPKMPIQTDKMFNVTPVRPKSEPRPVILIPVDDGVSEIEGITRDEKHDTITILNPLLHNISRAPLRRPPVGVVVDPKKDAMLKLRDRYLSLKDKEQKKKNKD